MNANELAEELAACGQFFEDSLYLKAAKMILDLETEIEGQKNLIRSLYGVVGWLQEQRPDVWEDMRQWIKNEKVQEK